ncbi:MAG: hypothetical protein Q8K26_00775 [Candidatus Gracilibacteria bacterium]|nr:hypothetical protein [Candidatus Gracilibacteria bacterium]
MKKTEYLTIEEAKMQGKRHILREAEVLRAELGKSKHNNEIYA